MHINAWWWRPRNKPWNFGDELGAVVLKKMGYKVKRVSLKKADWLLTGTILDIAKEKAKKGCIVWGSGAGWLHRMDNKFRVLAVRGRLTQYNLGVDVPLGDPGLLVSRYFPKEPPKYDVGVVRHMIDVAEYPWADTVIDASEPAEQVIKKISQCRTICSSSLHGIIVAESYGIPNMRIHEEGVISGNFKWLDYQTSLNRPINQIQDELVEAIRKEL